MKRALIKETIDSLGKTIQLNGWIHARRNMGKIVFFDLRDRTGLVQVVCVPSGLDEESSAAVKEIRPEFVVEISGVVQERNKKNVNSELETGKIEIFASKVKIISRAKTPPFEIVTEDRQANEELRLKYRYLDLRHERMRKNLRLRHEVIHFLRDEFIKRDFIEIQTPILSKFTPEGARDYLVPSRKHHGKFFALPQSPQQYKQLLMVSGFERYFQIAPCFRDEDARADRSPGEFYQLDVEMSFITQDDILNLIEEVFTKLIKEITPEKKITKTPWPRFTYAEAMKKYGNDKFDLRENKKDPNELAFAWVIDFPLFTEQTKEDFFHGAGEKWAPSHHMFTAPKEEDIPFLDKDPGKVRSYQHDLVLNGLEVGGGSIRIHDPKIQEKIFDLIGFTKEDKKKFAHILEAFEYGVPPHGGIAPGIDRLVSILAGEPNIREVIAFPLTSDARDPMMGAPSEVTKEQLDELRIQIKKTK